MSVKPTIEQLEEGSAYDKVLTLPYADLAPFVISNLRLTRPPMIITWLVLGISIFLVIWFWPGLRTAADKPAIILGLTTGLLIVPLILVPVHEVLHLIPYRLSGARDIRFGSDLRQGIIYVTAHRFVAGRKLFSAVALTPFIMITVILTVFILFCQPWWQWVLSLALFTHTTMCAGDAALLSYMMCHRGREVYTWDDAEHKVAYFYVSKISSP